MPEEFRIWKEKIDAIEQKKRNQATDASEQHSGAGRAMIPSDDALAMTGGGGNRSSSKGIKDAAATPAVPAIVYATAAEAMDAFKELLSDKKVTTTAKMKEVQELCQMDPRWEALKSQGEKKQGLAEYQVREGGLVYM